MAVAKVVAAQDFPDAFLRVTLGRARRNVVDSEVERQNKLFAGVPGGAIHKHEDVVLGMSARDFLQKYFHHLQIAAGQNQRVHFSRQGRNRAKSVIVFAHELRFDFRALAQRRPTAHRAAHTAETPFVLKHRQDLKLR